MKALDEIKKKEGNKSKDERRRGGEEEEEEAEGVRCMDSFNRKGEGDTKHFPASGLSPVEDVRPAADHS